MVQFYLDDQSEISTHGSTFALFCMSPCHADQDSIVQKVIDVMPDGF
jgi:hypothetical protein